MGTAISGVTDARGTARLDTTGLRDGFHTVRVEHSVADQTSPDVAGPTVADSLAMPPARIYRPLNVWVLTRGGQIVMAMTALFSAHGGIGNRTGDLRRHPPADRLEAGVDALADEGHRTPAVNR